MRKYIISWLKNYLREMIKEFLLDVIQTRIATLRQIKRDNEGKYDEIDNILIQAKMQALEEAYVILESAFSG
jgi:hypothetical protein